MAELKPEASQVRIDPLRDLEVLRRAVKKALERQKATSETESARIAPTSDPA